MLDPSLLKDGDKAMMATVARPVSGQSVDFTIDADDTGDCRPTRILAAEIAGAMVIMESCQDAFRGDTGTSGPALDLVASPAQTSALCSSYASFMARQAGSIFNATLPVTLHSIDSGAQIWFQGSRRSICIGPLINT